MVVWVNLVLKRIVVADFTVSDNSPIQDYVHLADHTQPTYTSFILIHKSQQSQFKITKWIFV